jgi:flagellar protein FliO/FliZ
VATVAAVLVFAPLAAHAALPEQAPSTRQGVAAAPQQGTVQPPKSAPADPAPARPSPTPAAGPQGEPALSSGQSNDAASPSQAGTAGATSAAQPDASVASPPAPAARPAPDQQAPQVALPNNPGPTAGPAAGSLLQTILALLFVLALLAGLAWVMKRFGPRAAGASANLRVVGALNIGGRERIMVVEVGDQWIVVGASPGRINALATLPRQEGVDASAILAAGGTAGQMTPASSFAEWLKNTIDKRNAK